MVLFRSFAETDNDYAQISTVLTAIWPDRDSSPAMLRHVDQARGSEFYAQRNLAEIDRRVVAVCDHYEPPDFYRPGKYAFAIHVHPAYERQGIGGALYAQMVTDLQRRTQSLTILTAQTRESKPQAVRFLQGRGFSQVMRSPLASLDVTTFDPQRFATLLPKLAAAGIELVCVADLPARDPEWRRAIYELDWECTLDEPLPDTPTKGSYEQYVAQVFDSPDFLPAAWFVALDQGRYVGMTATNRNAQQPRQLDTIFTATVRSHRRRGIATALKLLALDYAGRNGYTLIKTDNEEHNPMFQINLALGFQPEPALLFFQKEFR
jgi:GNAT superfamily N-acetyltransferase